MFYDWLSIYQDFDYELPVISETGYCFVDMVNGEHGKERQNSVQHEGSYSTTIKIHVKDNRIVMTGNPSRFNRLDNLIGYSTIEQCVAVYNNILVGLGLPPFTKSTKLTFYEKVKESGAVKLIPCTDGAVITCIHTTSNFSVGQGCVDTYLKALSSQSYLRRRARLHADGKTVDWLSLQGNAREIYPSVYDKAHEIKLKALPNVKRKYGEESPEYAYMLDLYHYCLAQGVARPELKINAPYLNKHNLQFYGLSDLHTHLLKLHTDFINLDKKLKVTHMNLATITEDLLKEGVVDNTKAANITALYAINWMHGQAFDFAKSQVQIHRARLRKIGIDIAKPCNLLTFSPVILKQTIEIQKRELVAPDFYQHPKPMHLRLVA